jgi:hypothetical protein
VNTSRLSVFQREHKRSQKGAKDDDVDEDEDIEDEDEDIEDEDEDICIDDDTDIDTLNLKLNHQSFGLTMRMRMHQVQNKPTRSNLGPTSKQCMVPSQREAEWVPGKLWIYLKGKRGSGLDGYSTIRMVPLVGCVCCGAYECHSCR